MFDVLIQWCDCVEDVLVKKKSCINVELTKTTTEQQSEDLKLEVKLKSYVLKLEEFKFTLQVHSYKLIVIDAARMWLISGCT